MIPGVMPLRSGPGPRPAAPTETHRKRQTDPHAAQKQTRRGPDRDGALDLLGPGRTAHGRPGHQACSPVRPRCSGSQQPDRSGIDGAFDLGSLRCVGQSEAGDRARARATQCGEPDPDRDLPSHIRACRAPPAGAPAASPSSPVGAHGHDRRGTKLGLMSSDGPEVNTWTTVMPPSGPIAMPSDAACRPMAGAPRAPAGRAIPATRRSECPSSTLGPRSTHTGEQAPATNFWPAWRCSLSGRRPGRAFVLPTGLVVVGAGYAVVALPLPALPVGAGGDSEL
jgi:hypothetical protein